MAVVHRLRGGGKVDLLFFHDARLAEMDFVRLSRHHGLECGRLLDRLSLSHGDVDTGHRLLLLAPNWLVWSLVDKSVRSVGPEIRLAAGWTERDVAGVVTEYRVVVAGLVLAQRVIRNDSLRDSFSNFLRIHGNQDSVVREWLRCYKVCGHN